MPRIFRGELRRFRAERGVASTRADESAPDFGGMLGVQAVLQKTFRLEAPLRRLAEVLACPGLPGSIVVPGWA